MGKLKLYDPNIPAESIIREREAVYFRLSPIQKIEQLFELIALATIMNRNKPLKNRKAKVLYCIVSITTNVFSYDYSTRQ